MTCTLGVEGRAEGGLVRLEATALSGVFTDARGARAVAPPLAGSASRKLGVQRPDGVATDLVAHRGPRELADEPFEIAHVRCLLAAHAVQFARERRLGELGGHRLGGEQRGDRSPCHGGLVECPREIGLRPLRARVLDPTQRRALGERRKRGAGRVELGADPLAKTLPLGRGSVAREDADELVERRARERQVVGQHGLCSCALLAAHARSTCSSSASSSRAAR